MGDDSRTYRLGAFSSFDCDEGSYCSHFDKIVMGKCRDEVEASVGSCG